jgi:hypothetical protein
MEQMNTLPAKETAIITAVTIVLYFCAILMFSYQITM